MPGVEVRSEASSGEVQVRGGNVMVGYLDDAEGTDRVRTADGWLRTADLGRWQGGRLIVDRLVVATKHLSTYAVPTSWFFVDELPAGVSGQVVKRSVGQRFSAGMAVAGSGPDEREGRP